MTAMRPKLKACPFCGGNGIYRPAGESWAPGEAWTAGCAMGCAVSTDQPTKKDAADWWNYRPKPARKEPT